jgi:adenylosuccinate synthase
VKKATIVTGLQFGDECKGATVDYLCSKEHVDYVVRFNGGFQAAHNVVMADGRHHTFSQFGSGTFRGVRTYLDQNVIVDPCALVAEQQHLLQLGMKNSHNMVSIHPDCLVSTIYHKIANRILDSRNGHGSCGVGIGLVRKMWSETGNGLFVKDLRTESELRRKLNWVRQWCQDQIVDYKSKQSNDINTDWKGNKVSYYEELRRLSCYSHSFDIMTFDRINRPHYNIIFEGSQGVGLDEVYGTIPNTTYSNTRPTYALDLCEAYQVKPRMLGLFRPYETRHGNGPMFKEDDYLLDITKDHNYNNGSFAGKFRTGHLGLDFVRKNAIIAGCDELVLNCADHASECYVDLLKSSFRNIKLISYGPTAEDRIEL